MKTKVNTAKGQADAAASAGSNTASNTSAVITRCFNMKNAP